MAKLVEHFIKGSDNQIALTLTEDGNPVTGTWTRLEIWIGGLEIQRTSDGDGVTLNTSTGVLTIIPGDLTEDLSSLLVDTVYSVKVVRVTAADLNGVVFGGSDATTKLYFLVTEKPT